MHKSFHLMMWNVKCAQCSLIYLAHYFVETFLLGLIRIKWTHINSLDFKWKRVHTEAYIWHGIFFITISFESQLNTLHLHRHCFCSAEMGTSVNWNCVELRLPRRACATICAFDFWLHTCLHPLRSIVSRMALNFIQYLLYSMRMLNVH